MAAPQITTNTIDLEPTIDGDGVTLTQYFVDGKKVATVTETDFKEKAQLRLWTSKGISQRSVSCEVAKAHRFARAHSLMDVDELI